MKGVMFRVGKKGNYIAVQYQFIGMTRNDVWRISCTYCKNDKIQSKLTKWNYSSWSLKDNKIPISKIRYSYSKKMNIEYFYVEDGYTKEMVIDAFKQLNEFLRDEYENILQSE